MTMNGKGKGKQIAGKATADKGKRSYDDDKTCGGRKRKNPGVIQFFEDEADDIDDSDESEDSDFSDDSLEDEFETLSTMRNESSKGQSSLPFMPKVELVDEEEYDRMMEERFKDGSRFSHFAGDDYDDKPMEPNSFHPTSREPTPTIWKVKCTVGRERLSAFCLMQKFVHLKTLGTNLKIISAFAVDHMKGFVYIEAERQCEINEACQGISGIYVTRVQPVPKSEVFHLFSFRSKNPEISVGMWARVKSGNYKGDLGQVMAVNDTRTKVTVKLIPRIDLQALAAKFGGGYSRQKIAVSAPRLISSSELEEFRPLIEIKRDRDTGKVFEVLDGMMLKDGYVYKKVSPDSLSLWGVVPTEEELLKFGHSENNESNDLEWLSQIYGDKKKQRVIRAEKGDGKGESSSGSGVVNGFELYDLVCFRQKDFGVIIGMDKDDTYKILKESAEGGPIAVTVEKRLIKSALLDLKLSARDHHGKTVLTEDHVRIVKGPSEGKQGIVKHIYRGIIFLYDGSEEENGGYFTAKANMCEKIKLAIGGGKDSEPGPLVFDDQPSSPRSPLSPEKPWQARENNREFNNGDKDSLFTIGQTLRIRIGPLKGYLCRVTGIRRSDVTVKLDSQQKFLTVKCEHLSEVQGKSTAMPRSGDPDSCLSKPFDFLGTEGSSGGWMDAAGTSSGGGGWNVGGGGSSSGGAGWNVGGTAAETTEGGGWNAGGGGGTTTEGGGWNAGGGGGTTTEGGGWNAGGGGGTTTEGGGWNAGGGGDTTSEGGGWNATASGGGTSTADGKWNAGGSGSSTGGGAWNVGGTSTEAAGGGGWKTGGTSAEATEGAGWNVGGKTTETTEGGGWNAGGGGGGDTTTEGGGWNATAGGGGTSTADGKWNAGGSGSSTGGGAWNTGGTSTEAAGGGGWKTGGTSAETTEGGGWNAGGGGKSTGGNGWNVGGMTTETIEGGGKSTGGNGWNVGGKPTETTEGGGWKTGGMSAERGNDPIGCPTVTGTEDAAWHTKKTSTQKSSWGAAVENKVITSDPDKSGGWGSSAGLISGSSEGAKEDSNWGKIKSGSITVPEIQDSEGEKGGNWNSVSQNACVSQGDGWAQKSNWKSGSSNDSVVKKSDWNSGNGGSQPSEVNNNNWNSGALNDNKNSNWSSGNPDPQTQDSDWGKKSNWNSGSGGSNQSTNWKSNGNWSTGSGDNLGGADDGLNETSEDGGGGGWRGGYRGRGGSDRGGFRGRGFRGRGERGGGERGGGFGGRGRSDREGFGGRWGSDRGFGGRGRGRVDQSGEDGSFDGNKGGWNQGASSNTTSWGQSNAEDKGQSSSWNESGDGSWGKKNDASDKGGW